ncbi:MAG: NlpC/P60 family protein [Parachlamydiaceae bacterium]
MNLFDYITVPVLNMRREPEDLSEVVSQGVFPEPVEVVLETEGWSYIKTIADGYPGWVKKGGICRRSMPYPQCPPELSLQINRLSAHLYHTKDTIYGPIMTLPFGCCLDRMEEDVDGRWFKVVLPDGCEAYVQRGDISIGVRPLLTREEMCQFSLLFLGLPYTWGGRSSFGYDCSGFVQMLYRQMGVYCPRDSQQQFLWEKFSEISVGSLNRGDLVFYGLAPDKIRHVGLWLGNGRFIHAISVTENAPYIRISSISDPAWNGTGYYPYFSGRTISQCS